MHQKSDVLKQGICLCRQQKGGSNYRQRLGGQQGEEGGTRALGMEWDAALASQQGGGFVSARGLLALGVRCQPGSYVTRCLHRAGHVPGAGK